MTMNYNNISVSNFTTTYDSIIQEALRRVNRDQEYIAATDKPESQHIKNSYREIFVWTLRSLIMQFGIFWAQSEVKLTQGHELELGWAYLPADFVAFLNPNSLQVDYMQEVQYTTEGLAISKLAGSNIFYLRQPKSLDDFPPAFLEVIIYGFLCKCGLRDANFIGMLPLVREEYNASVRTLERVCADVTIARKQRIQARPFFV